jgi:tRNA dimethylallyltransferase
VDSKHNLSYDLLIVTGPTASGKTSLAAVLASRLDGEIISADSRQVYRHMNLGTGKDYNDYFIGEKKIPFHLIDIADPGYKYNLFEYQRDFSNVLRDIKDRNKFPVVCGGSGMYIDSIVSGYKLVEVPPDMNLRSSLEGRTIEELKEILSAYRNLHNITDIDTKKRAIRAIEIERYIREHPENRVYYQTGRPLVIGILFDRDARRRRISFRLKARIEEGMIEEVQNLLLRGIDPETLIYYGLEYKFITLFLTGKLGYDEMFRSLEIAIHQFAKRQMTWFRGMERKGIKIHWINGELPMEEKVEMTLDLLFQVGIQPLEKFPLPDD